MTDNEFQPGSIRRLGDGYEGSLQRSVDHSPEQVWQMLTDPEKLAQWLAPGTVEQQLGGKVRIDFVDSGTLIESTVRAFEPGRLLEYSWSSGAEPDRPMRWALTPQSEGTQLELTVQLPAGEDIAKACAGFEGHLDMLLAALEGVPIHFPVDVFLQARKAYQAQVAGLAN